MNTKLEDKIFSKKLAIYHRKIIYHKTPNPQIISEEKSISQSRKAYVREPNKVI